MSTFPYSFFLLLQHFGVMRGSSKEGSKEAIPKEGGVGGQRESRPSLPP